MINIVKVKLENKTDKPFIYYMNSGKVTLNPGIPVIFDGDLFSRETRQEGNTEGLLVNVYNGNIELTLIYDDTFINKIEKDKVVKLPKRAQVKLINKDELVPEKEPVKEEPKKVEPAKEEPKPEVKEEPKKVEVKEEPKVEVKEEVKDITTDSYKKSSKSKPVDKRPEETQLKDTIIEDSKPKKQVAKI